MLQRIYFAYVFSYCIILATADVYTIRDISSASNDFEESGLLSRMFPNKYFRVKMTIPADNDYNNTVTRDRDSISIGDLNLNRQQKKMLRKSWKSSCDRKASRACVRVCVATIKTVCKEYKCSRSMRRSFLRECRSSCKSKFSPRKYSDDE